MNTSGESKKIDGNRFFQGIGIIYGSVQLHESQKTTIDIEGATYKLRLTKMVSRKLIPYLQEHPDAMLYLRVYPGFNFNSQKLGFQAIAFYPDKPESTQVNQFLLAGIWQYIPKLPDLPVMSIYRNELRGREKAENIRPNHLPVQGFAEAAYRYELKNDKENPSKRIFHKILVSLNPQQKSFEYLVTLDSTEDIPPYIKNTYQKPKPSQPKPAIKVNQMNFTLLQKTAIKLREAGFFDGKVSGKGVTKDMLFVKVQDSLSNHPEAVNIL